MKTYGLVGFPLGHSFSRQFFTEKFQKEGVEAEYINIEIEDISQIKEVMTQYPHLKGFNVTIPHKEVIVPYLDELDWGLKEIKAVNTIKVTDDGLWKGYNTDVIGFEKSIREVTDLDQHESALILGSGGASKAVQLALQKYRVPYTVVSRTPDAELFETSYDDITPEFIKESTLIINTTPLGMHPNVDTCPSIDYTQITSAHVCMDLVYNPDNTLFMQKCLAQGALVLNGYKMLVYQAEAAYHIWTSSDEA